jgi:MFS family permease
MPVGEKIPISPLLRTRQRTSETAPPDISAPRLDCMAAAPVYDVTVPIRSRGTRRGSHRTAQGIEARHDCIVSELKAHGPGFRRGEFEIAQWLAGEWVKLGSYENRLLLTLSLAEASMFVDRLALGMLAPFLGKELGLSNFQFGLLSSGFSLAYAVSGYVIAGFSDRTAQRRNFLIVSTLAFSVLSAATGFAPGLAYLLILRILLGVAEGPFLPILQSVMVPASSPHRHGFNVGFLQNVAPFLLGQLASPIVLTQLATSFNWRFTFFMTAIPGLLIIPFLYRLVPARALGSDQTSRSASPRARSTNLLRIRNVMLCVALAACTGTWILLNNTFLPLYLVKVGGYPATQMGFMMSLLGVGGCAASLILPALSDRIGRKPVLLGGFILGLATPLGVLLAPQHTGVLIATLAIGSCVLGCTPLTITIVPSDSVDSRSLARAIGLTSASSAIVGGVVMPAVAGRLADSYGLQVPIWITLGAMLVGIVVASALEKIPRAVNFTPIAGESR